MNTKIKLALIAATPLFLWGCNEHDFGIPKSEGEEAVFVVGTQKTRTMYANDQWDAVTNQQLFWGNYIKSDDEIKVFCGQGANKVGTYKIVLKDEAGAQGSPFAADVERVGQSAVQWGAANTAHTFYAFYPAQNVADNLLDNDKTVTAKIENGQSAQSFRAVVANGTVYEDTNRDALAKVYANSTQDKGNQTTIFCQPDMVNAVMVARTDMSAAQFGQDVPLDFNVIADVLDIQVNGPIIPNQLAGNAAGESRKFINVRAVKVEHKNGTPIVGTFNLDMSTSKLTSNITNGSSSILISLAQTSGGTTYNPTLYARVDIDNTQKDENGNYKVDPSEVDHLRVRAFLAPGVVKNLNELRVVVQTDCGDYTQELGDYEILQAGDKLNGTGNAGDPTMVAGKIHRLKLGYFMERGKQFDYSKWMSQLDPTIYINELSIPGSWHSTDSKYQGSTTAIVEQYKKGIRAFETHATCELQDPTLSNVTYGTPENSTSSSTQNRFDPATTADDRNPTSASDTRRVKRTITYTETITTPITATIEKNNYKVTNSAGNLMLAGITALGNAILDTEFAFIEIGSPGSEDKDTPVVGSTATATRTEIKTITKTQYGTQVARGTIFGGVSWGSSIVDDGITWDSAPAAPTQAEWNAAPVTSSKTSGFTYSQTKKINTFVGAVSWLINELKNAPGSKLYTAGVTPSTTLADVKGHYIIKVNTNAGDQDTETGWGSDIPALFSRWLNNSEDNINNAALKWGGPIAPNGSANMVWVFSEKDNVSDITNRHTAWNAFVKASLEAYKSSAHNAWFEFSGGGYQGGTDSNGYTILATAERCQALAKDMNPWLLGQISDAARQACPLGLVFFNYAATGDDNSDPYSSNALVRAIINNNAAFELRRAEPKMVTEHNNAHFKFSPTNPIK